MVLDEIVKKTLADKGNEDGINKPYTVAYDVVLQMSMFETTIKLAEAFNINLEEAIMVGVDRMAKSKLDHYIEEDCISKSFEVEDENMEYIINRKKSDFKRIDNVE